MAYGLAFTSSDFWLHTGCFVVSLSSFDHAGWLKPLLMSLQIQCLCFCKIRMTLKYFALGQPETSLYSQIAHTLY